MKKIKSTSPPATGMLPASKERLEVHEHCFIRGRYDHVKHSHVGGNTSHEHPDTGPACYTIDKDEWARTTGLRGGGRKRFTVRATGEQLPVVPRAPQFFDVFVLDSALVNGDDGELRPITPADDISGLACAAERMQQTFGLTARVHDLRRSALSSPAASGRPEADAVEVSDPGVPK